MVLAVLIVPLVSVIVMVVVVNDVAMFTVTRGFLCAHKLHLFFLLENIGLDIFVTKNYSPGAKK